MSVGSGSVSDVSLKHGGHLAVWGKSPNAEGHIYPLLCHLLDTAAVAERIWDTRLRAGLKHRLCTLLGCSDEVAKRAFMLAAGLHDVGKANPWFQYQEGPRPTWVADVEDAVGLPHSPDAIANYLRNCGKGKYPLRRHETFSYHAVAKAQAIQASADLNAPELWPWGRETVSGRWLAALVGGHHGYWLNPDTNPIFDSAASGNRMLQGGWEDSQRCNISLIEEVVGVTIADLNGINTDSMVPFIVLSGLLTIADWIASSDESVATGHKLLATGCDPHAQPHAWMEQRTVRLGELIDRDLGEQNSLDTTGMQQAILGSYQPTPLQIEAMQDQGADDAGLWICMYPTGDGKTEAAMLRHARRNDEGVMFALPTQATTDSMETRLKPWLEAAGGVFIKSHQFARQGAQADISEDSTDWYTDSIRKLVAPNVVCTCDQVLSGALANKHITLRLFGLANHHIILDEVHTFDPYQMKLLEQLLHWWGATGTRVTLLTATLPRKQLEALAGAYQQGADPTLDPKTVLLPQTGFPGTIWISANSGIVVAQSPPDGVVRVVEPATVQLLSVPDRGARIAEQSRWAATLAMARPQSIIGVFCNIVDDASAVASEVDEQLRSEDSSHTVVCLHSAMVQKHRRSVADEIVAYAGRQAHATGVETPLVIVGTQVLQASLNFSTDYASSDLCPPADLIQRLGRQWRFDNDAGRAKRTGGDRRTVRVVAVETPDKGIEDAQALPYLPGMLVRALAWLRDHEKTVFDVMNQSQAFLDETFSADTEKEIIAAVQKEQDASNAKADLRKVLRLGKYRRRATCWDDLVGITERDMAEDLMWTRWIDRPTRSVLLFDSTGRSGQWVGSPPDVNRLQQLSMKDALPLLDQVLKLPLRLSTDAALLDTAIGQTLDAPADTWKPRATYLSGIKPVDIKYLPGATYTDLTGFQFKKELS